LRAADGSAAPRAGRGNLDHDRSRGAEWRRCGAHD
jgi:hypothetical protein